MHKPGLTIGILSEGFCENRTKKAEGRTHSRERSATEGGKRDLWFCHGAKQRRPLKAMILTVARADLWEDGQVGVLGVDQP